MKVKNKGALDFLMLFKTINTLSFFQYGYFEP